jgi:thiol:disulfide interchange protein DsbD
VAALQVFPPHELAAQRNEDPSPHSDAVLIPEVPSVRPGEAFTVGLKISLDPGWHSYWLNPGDAGQPAGIVWDIPAGYRVSELQWPFPQKVEESTVVTYGYHDEVMLLATITPPRFLSIGQTVKFAAVAHWLVCNNICLPAKADLEFEIQISDQAVTPNPRWRESFEETRRNLPTIANTWDMAASRADDGFVLRITPERSLFSAFDGAFFFVSERGVLAHGAPQRTVHTGESLSISLVRSPYARGEPERLTGVLVMPELVQLESGATRAVVVDVPVSELPL